MPRGSVAQSESRTIADNQNKTLDLVEDPAYIARLRSKLIGLLTEEGPNGTVHLGQAFQQLDRQFAVRRSGGAFIRKASQHTLNLWTFKAIFAPLGLSDLEVEVLFALFLDDQDREVAFTQSTDADDGVASAIGTSSRMSTVQGGGGAARQSARDGPTIDGAEVMLAIRKMCHTISAQFHDVLKTRIRSRRLDPQSMNPDGTPFCPFFLTYQRNRSAPSRRDVFDFLTFELGLTDSEAFLCLEYFSLAGDRAAATARGRGDGHSDGGSSYDGDDGDEDSAPQALDTEYIIATLFEFPMPDDVAYPLLMSKLVEAITNPNRAEKSGMTAVLEVLLFFTDALDASGKPLLYGRKPSNEVSDEELQRIEQEDEIMHDTHEVPAVRVPCRTILATRWMDSGLFRKFCGSMTVGLPTGEVELLFGYLCDPTSGLLSFEALMEQILLRYPTVPLAEVQRAASATRAQLFAAQGPHALNLLHERLAKFQNRTVPPLQFCRAIRSLGVLGTSVPTVHVDAIRRVAGRCVQAVSLIRGALPPSRSETIEKLYLLLLDDCGLGPRQSAHSATDEDVGRSHRALASASRRDVGASPPPVGVEKAELLAIAVPKAAVLRRFQPELAPGLIPTAASQKWKAQLERYLASLHDSDLVEESVARSAVSRRLLDESPRVQKADARAPLHAIKPATVQFLELAYFWGNISPSVDDDSQFALLLWKAFSMHRAAPVRHPQQHSIGGGMSPPGSSPVPYHAGTSARGGEARRLLRD